MDEFEIELKQDFIEESEDLLANAEESFLKLEQDGADTELLNGLFRVAHNIKGTSKAVGFDQVATVTHYAESLLLQLKEGKLDVSGPVVDILFEFKDKIEEMINGLKGDLDAQFEIDVIVEKLKTVTDNKQSEAPLDTAPQVDEESHSSEETVGITEGLNLEEEPDEDLMSVMAELSDDDFTSDLSVEESDSSVEESDSSVEPQEEINEDVIESLRDFGFSDDEIKEKLKIDSLDIYSKNKEIEEVENTNPIIVEEMEDNVVQIVQEKPADQVKQPVAKKEKVKAAAEEESIRVRLSKIDNMNNIVGELVIMQTVLNQRRFVHINDELSNKSITQMSKLLKEIQELSMSLRMVPVKTTFQKMTRIVRDTSKALNKKIKLHLNGESTEVDKTILEYLSDPLVHMVRNSCDHGIETGDKRLAAGKEETGSVELLAFHEGSNLVIQITDDGGGIDAEVLRRKAIEKGVITDVRRLTEQETLQLIFHPGFSTKEEVSEVSGRGVGMDVVKSNIEKLGGEIKIMSKLGVGSSFKVTLPLTVAIVDGIIIGSDKDQFVLPLSQVHELTQVNRSDIEEFTGGVELFRLRGQVLPLFYLNTKVNNKVAKKSREIIIVVKGINYSFGVVVDDVIRQQQIVIKQIGEDVKDKEGIIGAAILGDGMPVFILDLFDLFQKNLKESEGYKKLIEQPAA